jgi:hypothetical protein
VAGERVAHDELLDGEGGGDVAARERADDRLGDAEVGKRGDVVSSFLSDLGEILQPLSASGTRRKRNLSGGRLAKPDKSTVAVGRFSRAESLKILL